MSALHLGPEFCLGYDDLLSTVQLLVVTRDQLVIISIVYETNVYIWSNNY